MELINFSIGKKIGIGKKKINYYYVGFIFGYILWTRSEYDIFGNTKNKWS